MENRFAHGWTDGEIRELKSILESCNCKSLIAQCRKELDMEIERRNAAMGVQEDFCTD